MIKLFRRIRQRLVVENKFSKYLLYAIGEIILVVIGILIALSINTSNTKRINRNESKGFNYRLLAEVNQNLQITDSINKTIEDKLSSTKAILELFNALPSAENLKSLDSLIFVSISGVRTTFRTGTLIEGLNTGKVALIDSEILKTKLYSLQSDIDYVIDYDENAQDFNINYVQSFLYDNFNYRRMDNKYAGFGLGDTKFDTQHNKVLLENEKFENLMDNHYFQSFLQMKYHKNLQSVFIEVQDLIKAELELIR